jgi:hypothetical protein
VRKTLPALEQEYLEAIQGAGGVSIGTWTSGVTTFNSYNEYAVYNGIPYKPRTTTELPYTAQGSDPTVAPDDANVQPYQEITEAQVVAIVESTIPTEIPKYTDIIFASVSNLIAGIPTEAPIGASVSTLGYYSGNDGGESKYIIKAGVTLYPTIDIDLGNGSYAELQIENSQIRIQQAGIKLDNGATVQKIKPVSDYANDKIINVELTNTATTQVHFDDEFHLENSRLVTSIGSYLYYKKPMVGGVPDDIAVVRFGSELADSRPAYFETTQQFRIGEALRFTPSQGYGEVLFQSNGVCYFKWFRPSGQGEVAPTTGTVTGSTSGSVQAYTPSTIDRSAVFGPDRNSGWDKLYLRTDELVGAHTQSTGIQVNGLRTGRRFGDGGDMTVEGFQTAGYWISNYFLRVKGTLEASKCADGHIFTDNNNDALIDKYIGTCGTEYDSIDRYRGYVYGSSSFHIQNLDLEFERGVARFVVAACSNPRIDSVNTERGFNAALTEFRGAAAIALMPLSVRDQDLVKFNWLKGVTIGGYYAFDTWGIKLGSYIDGIDIGPMTHLRDPATVVPNNWTSVLDPSGSEMIVGVKLNGANCNTFDITRKFNIDMSFPMSIIKFHDSNYRTRDFVFSQIKPASDDKLYSKIPLPYLTYFYIDSATMFVRGEASIDTRVRVVTSEGALASFDLDNASGDDAFVSGNGDDVYSAIEFITIDAWDLPLVEAPVTYTVTTKELTIN